MKSFHSRLALVVVVTLAAVLCILPTVNPNLWPHKKINLGLDLQGGMHVVLAADLDKIIENTLEQACNDIRSLLRKKQINALNVKIVDKKICVTLKGKNETKKFDDLLKNNFPYFIVPDYHSTNGILFETVLELADEKIEQIRSLAVNQALETIRNRIDQFGVNEPDIRLHGKQHILIQLPGIKDTERAKELIGRTAMLEFRIVNKIIETKTLSTIRIPVGSTILYKKAKNHIKGNSSRIPVLVNTKAPITGAHLIDAKVCINPQDNTPYVMIKLNKSGAKIFEQVTSENINKLMAIVLDGSIHSTPIITEPISGGQARITGGFTMENAKDLAIVLRAGALPVPVKIIEERTVGPSLGMDSIKMGFISICVGGFIVVVFMAFYYKTAGIIADLALVLNLLIIAAGLAGFSATLTLPGIAGIILTIGMAVDSNVLIFERIREEINLGRSATASVFAGYDRATVPILDANITTLIAALVLFQFGTGPIKGFAITLSLGVVASLFTSLILTRTIFDYLLLHLKIKKISI